MSRVESVNTTGRIIVASLERTNMAAHRATHSDALVARAVALVVAHRVAKKLRPPPGAYQPSDPAAGWNPAGGYRSIARPPGGSMARRLHVRFAVGEAIRMHDANTQGAPS